MSTQRFLTDALCILAGTLLFVAPNRAQSQTISTLYSFKGPPDGADPSGRLVRDRAGNFYGTTEYGGTGVEGGTIFRVDTSGNETVLYSFLDSTFGPLGGVIRDSAGNLYGTNSDGGSVHGGDVFKLDATGTESVLYSFMQFPDGAVPSGSLIRDSAGNLYGTAKLGGVSNGRCPSGCGTIFKVDTNGIETVLYSFTGGDGAFPGGSLIRDPAGNFYGTTSAGGDVTCALGCGTVFKLDTGGKETVLHSFRGSTNGDGAAPDFDLLRDATGSIYGITEHGGDPVCDCGTVFKVDVNGNESVLHSFIGPPDGAYPSWLVRDSTGNIYGVTSEGASSGGFGTVFKLDSSGNESVLYSFTGGIDGKYPSGLIHDPTGIVYGLTLGGGTSGSGVVFKLAP